MRGAMLAGAAFVLLLGFLLVLVLLAVGFLGRVELLWQLLGLQLDHLRSFLDLDMMVVVVVMVIVVVVARVIAGAYDLDDIVIAAMVRVVFNVATMMVRRHRNMTVAAVEAGHAFPECVSLLEFLHLESVGLLYVVAMEAHLGLTLMPIPSFLFVARITLGV